VAKAFKYGLKGITGYLEPAERDLLRSLIDDVVSMLQPEDRTGQDPLAALIGLDMDVAEPTDRAVKRLLPNVVKDDGAASLEFRQLTERSLRETKIGALRAAALDLDKDEIVLTPEGARHWSMALNDVRLVLAERLDIRDEAGCGELPGAGVQLHHLAAGVPRPGHAAVHGTPAVSSGGPGEAVRCDTADMSYRTQDDG
jgi:Domain of unknown function (DUF2017)